MEVITESGLIPKEVLTGSDLSGRGDNSHKERSEWWERAPWLQLTRTWLEKPLSLHQHTEYQGGTSLVERREDVGKEADKNFKWTWRHYAQQKAYSWDSRNTTSQDFSTWSVGILNIPNARSTPLLTLPLAPCACSPVLPQEQALVHREHVQNGNRG